MALAGDIMRYIGNEFVPMATKTASSSLSSVIPSAITKTGTSLATKAGASALGNVVNKAISNAANKAVEKSVLQNIGGRIFQNGKPKSFYHGSPNPNIDKLDLSKAGSNTQSGENVLYFTDDYPTAEEFSYERLPSNSMFINNRGKKGKVYEKQLDLKNLVDLGNLSDEQIGNLYEYADAINRYDGKEKFIQRVKEDLLAGNDQSIKTRLDLNALKNSDYDGFIAKMYPNQKGLENVREYGVFNPDNVRDVRHIPVEESSSLSSIIPVKRKLYRGQQYSNTDFSYNSELMNENPDKWGSKDVGKGYHFTPKKDMAGSWEGSNGGVIEVDYTPDQVLKADDARKMIEEANKLLADDKYMAKLWQENEALAEQIEKIADGNLEALAKREGKPFVQHLKANDDELGTMYYYKDIDPGLTDRFVSEFKQKAEKYMPNNNQQVDELVMPDAKLSPQQQEFFKDSVVRDEDGNLMPVFHTTNTNKRIDRFNADNGMVWVTPNKMYSTGFAGNGYNPNRTYELYANIKNPVYVGNIDPAINDATIEKLSAYTGVDEESLLAIAEKYDARNIWKITNSKDFKELMQAKGYDGIEAREGGNQVSYAAFSPEQVKRVGNLNPTTDPDINYSEIATANGGVLDEKTNRAIEIINQANNFGQPVENALYNKIDPSTLPKGYPELAKLLDSGSSSDNVIAKRVAEKIGTDDPRNADLDKVLDYLYVGDNREKRVFKKSLEEKIKKFERDSKALGLDIDDPRDRMTKSEMYKLFGKVWDKAKREEIDKIVQMSDGSDIMNALMDTAHRGIRTGTAGGLDTALSERLGIAPGNTIKISSDRYGDYGNPQSAGRYNRHYKDIAINSKGIGIEGQVSTMAHERLHSFQNEARPENIGRYDKKVVDAFKSLSEDLKPFLKNREDIKKMYGVYGEDKVDYWLSPDEQEARMWQNYLENEGITKAGIKKKEWGDEIKPAFDKFVKTLQKLSKEGKALPAIAGLFGIGALSANSNKEKS